MIAGRVEVEEVGVLDTTEGVGSVLRGVTGLRSVTACCFVGAAWGNLIARFECCNCGVGVKKITGDRFDK